MTGINELLNRALLVKDRTIPRDVVRPAQPPAVDSPLGPQRITPRYQAEEDLRVLCETFIARTTADEVNDFVTEQVPEPRSAVVLACLLHLSDTDAGARFWWQYAAGAGLPTAAYCLYLHHLALGEHDTARWWHSQIGAMLSLAEDTPSPAEETPPTALFPHSIPEEDRIQARAAQELLTSWELSPQQRPSSSVSTIVRVLRTLRRNRTRHHSTAVHSLMNYLPLAVTSGYLKWPGTVDLPTPGVDFARRIAAILVPSCVRNEGCGEHGTPVPSPETDLDSDCLPRRKPGQPRQDFSRLAGAW